MFTIKHLAVLLFLFTAVANANGIVESQKPENCIATRNQSRKEVQLQTAKPAIKETKRKSSNQE